jgi:BarA-like signal transduction histidine kinase
MTLAARLDHMRGLSVQISAVGMRVVYSGSGTLPASALLDDPRLVVEHGAYWAAARNIEEARYLTAILNSASTLGRIVSMQAVGAFGPRHFDNLVWELPISEYDGRQALHRELSRAAAEAECVAMTVPLTEGAHFTRQRRAIRDALAAHGIAARIDALVARLLER